MDYKVSLFASAIRQPFFITFLKSLEGTSVPLEVVFAGTLDAIEYDYKPNIHFKYIHTENIKPAQCYEIARRACTGETVHWTCDDAEYSEDCMGKAYNYWKAKNDEKLILSIQTIENGQFCNMALHSLYGAKPETPRMAPLGLMSRAFLDKLGGIDRRYVCGQYENDIVMRAIVEGGKVEIVGSKNDCYIVIDHYRRHGLVRPFATGYMKDREILERSWTDFSGKLNDGTSHVNIRRTTNGGFEYFRNDVFEPYEETDLLTKSQSNNNKKLWI